MCRCSGAEHSLHVLPLLCVQPHALCSIFQPWGLQERCLSMRSKANMAEKPDNHWLQVPNVDVFRSHLVYYHSVLRLQYTLRLTGGVTKKTTPCFMVKTQNFSVQVAATQTFCLEQNLYSPWHRVFWELTGCCQEDIPQVKAYFSFAALHIFLVQVTAVGKTPVFPHYACMMPVPIRWGKSSGF